jgi:DNA polymerase-3 subunit beta
MKFSIRREHLLKPLQAIATVVERRQTLPVLSNILISVRANRLSMTATDLEVELVADIPLDSGDEGDITLPARKLVDICRALPEGVDIHFDIDTEKARAVIKSGKSRFTLASLPAGEFPNIDDIKPVYDFSISQGMLKRLMDKTQFAMAQQDVRYYLNGLLIEVTTNNVCAVATDGHRLAMCKHEAAVSPDQTIQVILPRKGVIELTRLLSDTDGTAKITIGNNHIRVALEDYVFTSKLIDGRFPDYERVIPKNSDKLVVADKELMRQALVRTSILSNEKYRGIRLRLESGLIQAQANNPEMEEAEEALEVKYSGAALEIGFNVSYLLDALGAIETGEVNLALGDSNSSCVVTPATNVDCTYVIMPMRL